MGDEPKITDVSFSPPAADKAAGISAPSAAEIEAAARLVVETAVRARLEEIYSTNYDQDDVDDIRASGLTVEWPDPAQWSWVIEKFAYFYERDPVYAEAAAQHITDAEGHIKSGRLSGIIDVHGVVEEWAGRARDDFKQFFLDPFTTQAVPNQQQLFEELAVAMYAYDGVLKQARIDAKKIADEAVKVLDTLADTDSDDAKLGLAVAGIAVSIVSAVATGGTSLSITLGLIGAGLSAVSTGIDAANQSIKGGTVEAIMNSLRTVLNNLKTLMDAEEQSIANAIAGLQGEVDGLLGSSSGLTKATILPNEPDDGVTDLTAGNVPPEDEFRPKH